MARSSSRTAKTYPSKIDAWFLAIFGIAVGAMLVGMGLAASKEGIATFALGAFGVLVVGGFLAWILRSTSYTLDGRLLIIRSGPFSWRIGIDEITSIEKPKGFVRAHSSPALSMDRLMVTYRNSRRLMISPAEKEKFLADLKARQKSST